MGIKIMTGKRYYEKNYGDEYYIIDSYIISEKEFDEKLEIEGYKAFEDSLTGEEIVDLLNKHEQYTIKHWLNDYIQDHTIKVDKLPLYGNDQLIYQLPNKLEYIYFEKKWECIGEVEELINEKKEECG